jgi:hypothetical protein
VQVRFEETQEISFRKSGKKTTGVNLDYCDISITSALFLRIILGFVLHLLNLRGVNRVNS